MNGMFVYVYTKELRDTLLSAGAHLLKSNEPKNGTDCCYVFNADSKCLYVLYLYGNNSNEYTISSILTF